MSYASAPGFTGAAPLAGGATNFVEETEKAAAYPTKIIPAGKNYMYRQSKSPQTKVGMAKRYFQWFALAMDYGGDTYGPIISTWRVEKDLRLLDLSLLATRSKLAEEIMKDGHFKISNAAADIKYKLSFDYQYSGGAFNLEVHNLLLPILRKHGYDGTFVHDDLTDDEDGGATEIVLRKQAWRTRLRRL